MILATFKMKIPLEKHAEVSKILTRTVERTRVEPGCASCHKKGDKCTGLNKLEGCLV
jgi:quinol monooxygenase YgiN